MTEKMKGIIPLESAWLFPQSSIDKNWGILEQREGTHGLIISKENIRELFQTNYELFHRLDSESAENELMNLDSGAVEITVETGSAQEDQNFVSEGYVRRLREENESLRGLYEANKTQLADEQKTTAKYVEQRDDILDRYNEEAKKCRQMETLLQDKNSGQLLMFEWYSGIVEASSEDSATIVFETDDDVVEHLYEREQFTDGKIPEEGQRVSVCFYLSELQEVEAAELPKDWDTEDDFIDFRSRRKNVVKGPYTI